MPWGRVDDQHYRHEKVGNLDEDLRKGALALYWLAISWCNDRLTDGRVPAGTVRILGGEPEEAEELVRVGLWERDGKGYVIHDFLDFNKSKAQVEAERVQRTIAGQAGARARWHRDSDSPSEPPNDPASEVPSEVVGEPDGGSDAPVSRLPSPVTPSPAPGARDGLPNIDDEAIRFLEGVTGRTLATAGDRQLTEYDRLIGDHGLQAVMSAVLRAARTLPHSPKPTARQLVWGAMKVLEPMPSVRDAERLERHEEQSADLQRRIEATRRRIREMRGEGAA